MLPTRACEFMLGPSRDVFGSFLRRFLHWLECRQSAQHYLHAPRLREQHLCPRQGRRSRQPLHEELV